MFSLQLTRAHYSSALQSIAYIVQGLYWFLNSQSYTTGAPITVCSIHWLGLCTEYTVYDSIAVFVSMNVNKEKQTKTDRSLCLPTPPAQIHSSSHSVTFTWSTNWVAHIQPKNTHNFSPQAIANIRMIWLPCILRWHGMLCHTASYANRFALAF